MEELIEYCKAYRLIYAYNFPGQILEKDSPTYPKDVVLLDARNLYETRIGKFHVPNVETLDPGIRQYSDLPSWIDDNSGQLKGKRVLM